MVFKCVAYGCRSGYGNAVQQGVSFHKFPTDNLIRSKWLRKISRSNFVPTKYSRLCSLHFNESDFITSRCDSNITRKRKNTSLRNRRQLKSDSIPSKFENVPSYMTNSSTTRVRNSVSHSDVRRKNQEMRLQIEVDNFIDSDRVNSLNDIVNQLHSCVNLPNGYIYQTEVSDGDSIKLHLLFVTFEPIPTIAISVTIFENLKFHAYVRAVKVHHSEMGHISSGTITLFSQILNLLTFLKNRLESSPLSNNHQIVAAIDSLTLFKECTDDVDDFRWCDFILEQLELRLVNRFGRRYSSNLAVFSFSIYAMSSKAYESILSQNILILPSIRHLQRLLVKLSAKNEATDAYLRLRLEKLNMFERSVMLLTDEIYVAQRIEMSQGSMVGACSSFSESVPSTVLCFMVKSVASKYRDVVSMFPMSNLNAKKLYECFIETITVLVRCGFNVVGISLDNLSCNHSFYKMLGGGELKTQVENPINGEPLFLLFDNVHNFKNLYNNFLKRRTFICPGFPSVLSRECRPSFDHIKELYELENQYQLRKAHKLSSKALNPNNLQKTSVKLANSVFNESTYNALVFYSETQSKCWDDTALFLNAIIKFWSVTNVRTPTAGKQLRDTNKDPITSVNDWKLTFLQEFADFLYAWEQSKRPGLSNETFRATRHTCCAMIQLSKHLLIYKGFNYVLLGCLSSDPLEQRYGWYRQSSGANYYISFKQILDSERKIKVISLLKYSECSPEEIRSLKIVDVKDDFSEDIFTELEMSTPPILDNSELSSIYYCAGALSRSTLNLVKCQSCRDILVSADETLEIEETNVTSFVVNVDRGGLLRPTDFSFQVGVKSYIIFKFITNCSMKKKFLSSLFQREIFLSTVSKALESDDEFSIHLCQSVCENRHAVLKSLIIRFYNTLCKNFMHSLNDMTKEDKTKNHKLMRKSKKLSSK